MPQLWCSDDMLRVVQLHRDGMPICVAARCSRDGMPMCEAAQCSDVTPGWDTYM